MNSFLDFKLKDKTLKALENINFMAPTNIQNMVLPTALAGKNFACKGQTGSGKTHCFIIPIAEKIDENQKKLQSIILVPTRELAMQIDKRFQEFFKDFDVKITCLIGGIDTLKEKLKMSSTPQILIGTPEKITQIAIDSGLVNLSTVNSLVIDEADMTLEMGFLNEVDRIALLCKKAQIMIFSATIPAGIKHFIKKYFKVPLTISDSNDNNNENIEHILYPVRGRNTNEILLEILKEINPYVCLIFANRKEKVNDIYKLLLDNGYECGIIHGDLQSRERKANIKRALNGQYKYIVCSDIAARGIDIEGVSHVISMDLPKNNLEFYTHRAGRAGRLNMIGQCITLFDKSDKETLKKLEKQGIVFKVMELKKHEWVELKDFNARAKRKNTSSNASDLQKEISKTVRMNKSNKVKPNHKKKLKEKVAKVKQKYHRAIIQNDIKKRIKERAIKKNKGEIS